MFELHDLAVDMTRRSVRQIEIDGHALAEQLIGLDATQFLVANHLDVELE